LSRWRKWRNDEIMNQKIKTTLLSFLKSSFRIRIERVTTSTSMYFYLYLPKNFYLNASTSITTIYFYVLYF
jgi:hypothetical protein